MKIIQFFKESFKGVWLVFRYGPGRVSQWREESIIDPLTGLYNRRFLEEIGKRELAKVKRLTRQGVSYPISIIFVDIDDFKKINDEKGHAFGDKVLKQVAVLLKEVCRRETDVICRVGGDEFVILLSQTTKENAQIIIGRLKESTEIGLSCGLSQELTWEELHEKADVHMYQNKKRKAQT